MEKLKKKYPVVTVFRNLTDTNPYEQKPLDQILLQIDGCVERGVDLCRKLYKAGDMEAYNEKKKKLKCFTVSGRFEGGRKGENLKEYSGFIVLDIDNLSEEQVLSIKQKVCSMPLTFCCFISPSEKGLKILVQVNSKVEQHAQAFNQLKSLYEKELGVEIDKSGKDVNRLCIYSCDSKIYANEEASIFNLQVDNQIPKPAVVNKNNGPLPSDKFQRCVKLTENIYQFVDGSRNNFVHLLAANCNRYGIEEQEAIDKIKADYNYDDLEVSKSIRSAYKNNPHEFGKFSTLPIFPPIIKNSESYVANGVVALTKLIDRNKKEPPIPFIWSGIKKGSFGFIFGPSKSGKTIFAENLAMSLAANLDTFLGMPITKDNYKVLFISLEEYWQNRTERNSIQTDLLNNKLGSNTWLENYLVIDEQVPRLIATDEDWEKLENMIIESKANVVIIDSLSRLYQGVIEDSSVAKKVSLKLRELTDKLKITLIVIHHTPKQNGKAITQDSLAGSRILAQEADFIIGINRSCDNKRYMKEISFRYKQEQQDVVTLFEIGNNQWIIERGQLPESEILKENDRRIDTTNLDQVYNFMLEKTSSLTIKEVHIKDLFAALVDTAIMSKQTLYSSLKRLGENKKIKNDRRGVYIVSQG